MSKAWLLIEAYLDGEGECGEHILFATEEAALAHRDQLYRKERERLKRQRRGYGRDYWWGNLRGAQDVADIVELEIFTEPKELSTTNAAPTPPNTDDEEDATP